MGAISVNGTTGDAPLRRPIREIARALRVYVVGHRRNVHRRGIHRVLKALGIPLLLMMWAGPMLFAYSLGVLPPAWTVAGRVIAGTFALLLVSYATLMLNDLCDREIDAVVHPERPLPQGKVDPRALLHASMLLYLTSFAVAALISVAALLVLVVQFLLSAIHYGYTKRRLPVPGSSEFLTALQWSVVPAFCFAVAERYDVSTIAWLTAFIYLADVSLNVGDGVRDRAGDAALGVRTTAAVFGGRAAAVLALALFLAAVGVGVAAWWATALGPGYLALLLGMGVLTFRAHTRLLRHPEGGNTPVQSEFHSFASRFFMLPLAGMGIDAVVRLSRPL